MRTRTKATYDKERHIPLLIGGEDTPQMVELPRLLTYQSAMVDSIKQDGLSHPVSHSVIRTLPEGFVPIDHPADYPRFVSGFRHTDFAPVGIPSREILRWVEATYPRASLGYLTQKARELCVAGVNAPLRFGGAPKVILNPGNFSMLNFLIELGELVPLFRSYMSSRAIIHRLREFTPRDVNRIVNAAANEHLAYKYGLHAFIIDVDRIIRILARWRSGVERIVQEAYKIKSYRASADGPVSNSFTLFSESVEYPVFEVYDSSVHLTADAVMMRQGTIRWNYSAPDLVSFHSRLFHLLDSLGVNPDVSIAWNALPLSFVLDWFIPVGDYLQSVSRAEWTKIDVHLLDYCYSSSALVRMTGTWNAWPHYANDAWLTRLIRMYRRDVGKPTTAMKFVKAAKGWTIGKTTVCLSLAVQRANRPRSLYGKVRRAAYTLAQIAQMQLRNLKKKARRFQNARAQRKKAQSQWRKKHNPR